MVKMSQRGCIGKACFRDRSLREEEAERDGTIRKQERGERI